jgi:hypothetical protein
VRRPHIRSDGRACAVILRLDLKRVLREQLSILNLPNVSYPEPVLANECFCRTNKTEKENRERKPKTVSHLRPVLIFEGLGRTERVQPTVAHDACQQHNAHPSCFNFLSYLALAA